MLVALVLKRYLTLRSPRWIKPSSSTSPHLPCLYPLSSSLITRGKFYFPKHFAPAFFLMFLLEDFPELLCDSSHSLLSSSGEGNTGLYIYTCMISSVVVLNRHQEIREEWSQLGLKTRIGSYCYIMYVLCNHIDVFTMQVVSRSDYVSFFRDCFLFKMCLCRQEQT